MYDKAQGTEIPDYPILMGLWKLATKLRMAPLRIAVLDTMSERRQLTSCIPGTPLLIQAWQETQEGSGLRHMLIGWSAEHSMYSRPDHFTRLTNPVRASPEARKAFATSLPQEILSELVVVMSELPATPAFTPRAPRQQARVQPSQIVAIDLEPSRPAKRSRKSDAGLTGPGPDDLYDVKPPAKKAARRSDPIRRKGRMAAASTGDVAPLSPEEDLEYCRGMINRMVLGPGYWTRLVKAFRNPVDPVGDNVPDYLDVVKKPMDLMTIKGKMERNEYATAAEFERDVRQIFHNSYQYWDETDPIYTQCQSFESYFNTQWAGRHKYALGFKSETAD